MTNIRALSRSHQRPYSSHSGGLATFPNIGPYVIVGTFMSACVGLWGFYQYEANVSDRKRRRSKWLDTIDKNFLFSEKALDDGRYWTLVTNSFMHQSPSHLLLNMIGLYQWGIPVVSVFGPMAFLEIWIGGAIACNLAGLYWNRHKRDPWLQKLGPLRPKGSQHANAIYLGASGSIFSLLGIMTCLAPQMKIAIFPIPVGIPMVAFSTIFVSASLAAMIEDWIPWIGHAGHVGGLAFGVLAWYGGLRRGIMRRFPRLR